jgi:hypothetical protein
MSSKSKKKSAESQSASIEPTEQSPGAYQYVFPTQQIPSVYSNNAQLSASDMDMRIDMCEIQEVSEEKGERKILVTPKVRLFLSWPFAARLATAMQQQIETRKKMVDAARAQAIKDQTVK